MILTKEGGVEMTQFDEYLEARTYLGNSMYRAFETKTFKLIACAVLGIQAIFLSGCVPEHPAHRQPILHTTISADGQMVATLLNAGTDEQLLRIRNLGADTNWRTVQAPPLTQTIRFGIHGHELLVTHRKPDLPVKNYLSKFDLDKPEKGLQKIYESEEELAFPVEVKPGQVMVRTHQPANPSTGKVYLSDHYWILVGPGQKVQEVGPKSVLPYSAPNIVGSGFFWTEDQIGKEQEAHPMLLSFPLPGGRAPDMPRERLEKNTFKVYCDQSANRCLRRFISNLDQKPAVSFIYDMDVLFGSTRCKLPGVAGSGDAVSVTPDGNAAVMSLASRHDRPRHAVVIRFNPQQCEATSVQHIYFEEK